MVFTSILFFIAAIGVILAAHNLSGLAGSAGVTPLARRTGDVWLLNATVVGAIAAITITTAPKELDLGEQRRRRISVFMDLFDCHVNRAPVGGT